MMTIISNILQLNRNCTILELCRAECQAAGSSHWDVTWWSDMLQREQHVAQRSSMNGHDKGGHFRTYMLWFTFTSEQTRRRLTQINSVLTGLVSF